MASTIIVLAIAIIFNFWVEPYFLYLGYLLLYTQYRCSLLKYDINWYVFIW